MAIRPLRELRQDSDTLGHKMLAGAMNSALLRSKPPSWSSALRTSITFPVKTTLVLFMVLVYDVYHLLRQSLPSDCEWQRLLTSSHPPAVPLLSALASLVSPCTNLL